MVKIIYTTSRDATRRLPRQSTLRQLCRPSGKSRQALGITSRSDNFDVLLLVVAFQERGIRGAGLAGQ